MANDVSARLGIPLIEVSARRYAGQAWWNAYFDIDGTRFALVPGGEAAVGYNTERYVATVAELASFRCEEDDPLGVCGSRSARRPKGCTVQLCDRFREVSWGAESGSRRGPASPTSAVNRTVVRPDP
ncbi:MAG TPA: hypothetical protein VGR06_12765 [Actinophytocola sp.]|uniref:hypothetical protein n=1 Tax=Actinophytocola sp. TaxID=1872138 RepID=UPI002DFB64A8|nr:hypothetical protein [Actinophytocola sp.]